MFERSIPQRDKFATLFFMLATFIFGIILVWRGNYYRIALNTKARDAGVQCSQTAKNVTTGLIVLGVIVMLAPLIFMAFTMTGNYGKIKVLEPLENVLKAQVIGLIIGFIALIIVIWLGNELKVCKLAVDSWLWASVIIYILLMVGLVGYRYFEDQREIKRLETSWTPTNLARKAWNSSMSRLGSFKRNYMPEALGGDSPSFMDTMRSNPSFMSGNKPRMFSVEGNSRGVAYSVPPSDYSAAFGFASPR